jgi:hypothetical protein
MHHQVRGFVDDEVILRFVEYGEVRSIKTEIDGTKINRDVGLCPRISRETGVEVAA